MPTSKFLKLAGELRNNIYEHALKHDRSNGIIAAAGLLRTCRQIYGEAKQILYEDSTFTIVVKPVEMPGGDERFRHRVLLTGDVKHLPTQFSVLAIRDVLPYQILDVPRVHIKLDLEGADLNFPRGILQSTRTGPVKAVNRLLFALVDLLNSDGLRRHVTLSATPMLTSPVLANDRFISWPLVKLYPRIELELKQGFEPTAVQAFQDKIVDLRNQHAVEDLGYTPLTDFRRIQSLIQRPSVPRNRMHGFARKYYGDAAGAFDVCDCWIHAIDRDTSVMIIMANGLFDVAERQEDLADAIVPPEFLRRVFRVTAADEGYEAAQQELEDLLNFLSERIR